MSLFICIVFVHFSRDHNIGTEANNAIYNPLVVVVVFSIHSFYGIVLGVEGSGREESESEEEESVLVGWY